MEPVSKGGFSGLYLQLIERMKIISQLFNAVMLLVWSFSCSSNAEEAGSFSLSGSYILSTHGGNGSKLLAQYHADFVFERDGNNWKVEILNNGYLNIYRKQKWVCYNGDTFHTAYNAVKKPNVHERTMQIHKGKLPAFDWNFATAILLMFAPDLVIQGDPPSVPISVFRFHFDGMPERVFCEYGFFTTGRHPTLKYLNVEAEKGQEFPKIPRKPLNPVIRFSCEVSDPVEVAGIKVPSMFHFKAFSEQRSLGLPKEIAEQRNEIYLGWKVDASVEIDTIKSKKQGFLKPVVDEGDTYISDFRIRFEDGDYLSYVTKSNIMEPDSDSMNTFIAGTRKKIRNNMTIIYGTVGMMALLSVTGLLALVFFKRGKVNRRKS